MLDQVSEVYRRAGCPFDDAPDSVSFDCRFRDILGLQQWAELPAAVQKRFSKILKPNLATIYAGHVEETRLSRAGRVLAACARIIGGPLPYQSSGAAAAVVSVIDDPQRGGQNWTRTYARDRAFPQVVHSAKLFHGPTGLEEYVGCGVGMTLKLHVDEGALVFTSDRYFIGGRRMRAYLPEMISPGVMTIVHRQEQGGWFSFQLTLTHSALGELLFQRAMFKEV